MEKKTKKKTQKKLKPTYKKFQQLDGSHPLQEKVSDVYVPYKARVRKNGKLVYFNFNLGKEMGLISKDHPIEMNEELEKSVLEAFSLVIINEYDEENNKKFKEEELKPGTYMATRYLQPQHKDKVGLTSGDGRSIWNGFIQNKGKTWDVSSRGTGATKLSPATSKFGRFFESGDPTISYGCGYAELDEALESTFFSEVLHRNGLKTERTLAIIEFEKGIVVAVRAYENLLRPSHFFRYLKQNNLESLEKLTEYYIERQESNGKWLKVPKGKKERLRYFFEKQLEVFAKTAAKFEDEYIFCWIDWDGDNILMDGAIIDYGSVRQFGMYHHGYKFDDDGKYSITIDQQKKKARYITQTFLQMIDALNTGTKKNIKEFDNHKDLLQFDKIFEKAKNENLIKKIGFHEASIEKLAQNKEIEKFRSAFAFFERVQSKLGSYEVSDGVSHDAIFCMRDILRELPQLLLCEEKNLDPEDFLEIIRSSYAEDKDLYLDAKRKEKISLFQRSYRSLLKKAAQEENKTEADLLLDISMRSSVINKYDRITGDAITMVVDKILKAKPKLSPTEIFHVLESFISYQDLNPDKPLKKKKLTAKEEKLLMALFTIVRDYREGL